MKNINLIPKFEIGKRAYTTLHHTIDVRLFLCHKTS